MFLQLPRRYSPKRLDDLGSFLAAWPAQVQLAVEVRHSKWFESPHQENFVGLLKEHEKARVVIDTRLIRSLSGNKILEGSVYQRMLEARGRKPDLPVPTRREVGFTFLRFIGHPVMDQTPSSSKSGPIIWQALSSRAGKPTCSATVLTSGWTPGCAGISTSGSMRDSRSHRCRGTRSTRTSPANPGCCKRQGNDFPPSFRKRRNELAMAAAVHASRADPH
jgi:hypothetical protein